MAVLGLRCCVGFSLVVASRSYSSVGACGLLTAAASLVEGYRFNSCSSRTLEHRLDGCGDGLGCTVVRGIFLDQGLNPCLLH